jgi:hypothetical protein
VSFDIFFRPCHFGGKPVKRRNPFTGQIQSALPNEPLSASELMAMGKVLPEAKARGPDQDGCYLVELGDGGRAEVFGLGSEGGCMVSVQGMTPVLSQLLHDLLAAADWIMLPAMEEAVAVMTSRGSLTGIPNDFPRVVVCDSAGELAMLLAGGVRAWEKYRDQVVGGSR